MDNKKILYGINLDDYWYPEHIRPKSSYIGTQEDLEEFAKALETFGYRNEPNHTVSTAIRRYFDGSFPQSLVNKYGNSFECLQRLEVVYQSEVITLDHHYWQYKTVNDAVYPMFADHVYVKRLIVMNSGFLYTAIKGIIVGLRVCIQGTGWMDVNGMMSGFPEMVTYDSEEGIYEMRLYAVNGIIKTEEIDEVIQSWSSNEPDLDCVCQDIIAEGKVLRAHPKGIQP